MKVTVLSSRPVKPDYGACGVPPGSAADVVPLTVLDKANFDAYISVIYAFRPPAPPNAVLEAGLAKALVDYREWAGRLGVDAEVLSLHPSGDDGPEELMLIQVTRFACGSIVVGFTAQHLVSDGRATSNFFLAWSQATRGVAVDPVPVTRFACGSIVVGFTAQHLVSDGRATSNFFLAWSQATRGVAVDPVPVHDRASFFKPRDPPQVEYEHRGVEFKPYEEVDENDDEGHAGDGDVVVVNKVHLSLEFISKLKSRASVGAHRPYSTLRCLVAHLWRCVTKARGLDGSVSTSVAIAVDGRARMSPQVPDGYTGNVVLWARPTATAQELVTRPLQHAVELINREVARINGDYFESFIDFASSEAVQKERLVPTADAAEMALSPNIEVDSWLRIPFYDLDFGGGQPFFFMPSYLPVEGLLILLPSFAGDGSVDAYVPLFSRDMDAFKNCCYNLE
ncbi:Agmatine coumaroyltransferase-2 [Triticum urartu]|uniref:Agmatine coumaroyltransferase-2 n=1 Tax=Triticum urartu TaxID=4572 RepID=M7ZXA7_TRIUA|nr:Agmatine coumaroyltransferase-2 [Triticum urartu]